MEALDYMYLFSGINYKARLVEHNDAQIIYDWRKSDRARCLNVIPDDVKEQYSYIERSLEKFRKGIEIYVIVEDIGSKPVGCFRITDFNEGKRLNYQSILFIDNIDPNIPINVIFSTYQLCFEMLGRTLLGPFQVAKQNTRVLKLHRLMPLSKETVLNNGFIEFEVTTESFFLKRQFFTKMGFGIVSYDVDIFKY